jgi:PKD repeat protein
MNAEGDTAVSWPQAASGDQIAEVAIRPVGGVFGSPVSLSEPGNSAEHPEVALDGRGDPTVVWSREADVQVRTGTVSGSFPAAPVTIAYPALFASIAEDAAGDTLVGYFNAHGSVASAAFRPAGGLFSVSELASPVGEEVSPSPIGEELGLNVAMDGQGDGVFGFHAKQGSGEYLAGAGLLDAAGPLLNGLSIPTSATAGVPVTFSVAPVDQLSGVAGTTWTFGDSSTAAGSSVTHAFAEPGTYTVSVTSTDGVGNSRTQTGTVAVTPAPIIPPAQQLASNPAQLLASGSTVVTADSHGHLHLKVLCPAGGAACAGTVALTLPAKATGLAVAARAKPQGVPVTVTAGHASFSVVAGTSQNLTIALSATVLKLLIQHHTLKLTAIVETHASSGQIATKSSTVVVKASAKPGKKPKQPKKKGGR